MKIKTVWEYSIKTEAERLLHDSHHIATGFYKINNFIVLPYFPKANKLNLVTFPDLPYNTVPRFWDRVKSIDANTLPIKANGKLISRTAELLKSANLPRVHFAELQKRWAKAESEVLSCIYKIIPSKKGAIKKIIIYPTAFGTSSSSNWISKDGIIVIYLRYDQGIATIVEAIITSLTRRDIYGKLEGMWQESEIITDWLITQSALADIIKKYDNTPFMPTLKGVRIKQQAKLLEESDNFYKKLGFPASQKIFGLNGLTPEINKKPVENLSATEKVILKLLIESVGGVVSFDDIASQIFKDDQNFSLYAIAKNIERLRNKLEANGVSGSCIQTLRGKGYILKN